MSNRNIFFDLDGTLLDVRARLYNLFIELAPETLCSLDEYWEIKRNGISQASFLEFTFAILKARLPSSKKCGFQRLKNKKG